jgi:hypothetical protein
VTVP